MSLLSWSPGYAISVFCACHLPVVEAADSTWNNRCAALPSDWSHRTACNESTRRTDGWSHAHAGHGQNVSPDCRPRRGLGSLCGSVADAAAECSSCGGGGGGHCLPAVVLRVVPCFTSSSGPSHPTYQHCERSSFDGLPGPGCLSADSCKEGRSRSYLKSFPRQATSDAQGTVFISTACLSHRTQVGPGLLLWL